MPDLYTEEGINQFIKQDLAYKSFGNKTKSTRSVSILYLTYKDNVILDPGSMEYEDLYDICSKFDKRNINVLFEVSSLINISKWFKLKEQFLNLSLNINTYSFTDQYKKSDLDTDEYSQLSLQAKILILKTVFKDISTRILVVPNIVTGGIKQIYNDTLFLLENNIRVYWFKFKKNKFVKLEDSGISDSDRCILEKRLLTKYNDKFYPVQDFYMNAPIDYMLYRLSTIKEDETLITSKIVYEYIKHIVQNKVLILENKYFGYSKEDSSASFALARDLKLNPNKKYVLPHECCAVSGIGYDMLGDKFQENIRFI